MLQQNNKGVCGPQCQPFAATSSKIDYLSNGRVGEVADRSRRRETLLVQKAGDMNLADLGDTNEPTVFLS
jgi:hypothetical protein